MKFEFNAYKAQLTDEEILADIKDTAKLLGSDYISISAYRKHGRFSQTAIQSHFGTWKNALQLAGLRSARKPSELKSISDEEYFLDLRRVVAKLDMSTVPYADYKCMENIVWNIFLGDSVNGTMLSKKLAWSQPDLIKTGLPNRNVLMR